MSEPSKEKSLRVTRDGSHTIFSEKFDQHYHNPNGAVAESRYVFFEQTGLVDDLRQGKNVTILETGFGTGLNLMLLLDYYLQTERKSQLQYYTIEAYPLSYEMAQELNYAKHLQHEEVIPEVTSFFKTLSPGMNETVLLNEVPVHLFYGLFEDVRLSEVKADYIFHDAFSPGANPDLWAGQVFKKLYASCLDEGVLSTYCAASKARGAMAWAGWKVARARGALGKREMTLAARSAGRLGELKRINEERLAQRYEEGDF